MGRMERYSENENKTTNRASRLNKNQRLYDDFANNVVFTNITDVTNANAYEINNNKSDNSSYTTREAYQQMQKYQNVEPLPKEKKELEDVNFLSQKKETKVYDINSVLEEARKNRGEVDLLDDKRKLKNKDLNILSGKNRKALEKYREEKKKRLATPEEEEIRELMDTIASKTLAGELDKEETVDLLSDLMATNMLDKVDLDDFEDTEDSKELLVKETITEVEILPEEKEDKEKQEAKKNAKTKMEEVDEEIKDIEVEPIKKKDIRNGSTNGNVFEMKDPDFYTRSMDLSDKDFEFGDFGDKKLPLVVKIILIILIIAIIAVAGYFIVQKML